MSFDQFTSFKINQNGINFSAEGAGHQANLEMGKIFFLMKNLLEFGVVVIGVGFLYHVRSWFNLISKKGYLKMKRISELSERELEMIEYVALGFTAKQIAIHVGIEHRTVQTYLLNVKRKLRARNLPQAIFLACRAGCL